MGEDGVSYVFKLSVISNTEDCGDNLGKFLSAPSLSDTTGVPALPFPSTELVKEDDLARNRALSQFSGLSLLFWLAKTSAPGTASAAFVRTAAFCYLSTLATASIQALHPSLLSAKSEALSTRLHCRESMLGGIDMAVRQSLLTLDPLSPAVLEVDQTKILFQTVPHKSLLMFCTGTQLLSLGHIDSRQGLLGELLIPDLPVISLTLQLHPLQRLFVDRRLVIV
ncbi:hypothetical protein Pcinc_022545 [Petrolisthes cinctipes]|uniref:Uncharacterized protein n=1 Tax=Petrolisthes cinctipes TaxID=88211 RepID=A0AAE1FG24_PETCI|nr:hypothetical protein Pcinc_022545 [Petrolisthes cinctipes]